MKSLNILNYIASYSIFKININQRNALSDTIYITILDFTDFWYYNIVINMAHVE